MGLWLLNFWTEESPLLWFRISLVHLYFVCLMIWMCCCSDSLTCRSSPVVTGFLGNLSKVKVSLTWKQFEVCLRYIILKSPIRLRNDLSVLLSYHAVAVWGSVHIISRYLLLPPFHSFHLLGKKGGGRGSISPLFLVSSI